MKHVDHLLAPFVDGTLSEAEKAAVRGHAAVCARCRDRLARRESVAADLRLVLGQNPVPRERQIDDWWREIMVRQMQAAVASAPRPSARASTFAAMLPALLTALVLILPVSLIVADQLAPVPQAHTTTAISPSADTTNQPPADFVLGTQELTHEPVTLVMYATASTPQSGYDTTPAPMVAPPAP